ncbi:MAG: DUF2703 domain-containing protein [Chloroflexi bacterium]|nr:DUF2703 domain-containing protein [Chloroflexota bacterium]
MKVQFLFWEDCPSHPEAWDRLHDVLRELGVEVEVERIEVTTEEAAQRWHFAGSPTILVNGKDIDAQPDAPARLTCRLYFHENGRPSPLPSREMIIRAINAARANRNASQKG